MWRKANKRLATLLGNKLEGPVLRAAEIGVWRGKLSKEFLNHFPNMHLYCIDLWENCGGRAFKDYGKEYMEDIHRQFKKAVRKHRNRVTEIQLPSIEAAKEIEPESLDFVFIDALHDFKSVLEDIEAWESRVRPGGIVSGHDYFGRWDDTSEAKAAVTAYAKQHKITIKTKRSLDTWWFKK